MLNKILFLDIDGVLNMYGASYYSFAWTNLGTNAIERHLVRRLEFILELVSDLNIVISSSWRQEPLINKLTELNFKYMDRIVGRTPRRNKARGLQILDYINEHDVHTYIVLEDEIADVVTYIDRDRIIEVDMNEGLSNKNAIDTVISINNLTSNNRLLKEYNKENYEMLIELGYRPSILHKYTEGKFKTIEIYNNDLSLRLT